LSEQDAFLKKVYEAGYYYEKKFSGCAQGTIAGLQDFMDIDDAVFKAATLCGGGICSTTKGICGGLAGGLLIIGSTIGRDKENFAKKTSNISKIGRMLIAKFQEEYGTFTCNEIQTRIFGRKFDLTNKEDREIFEQMGAHTTKCPSVVGKATQWAMEIMLEQGIVKLKDGKVIVNKKLNLLIG
jgi:C_GCAxxG_C_C family probable redox protein